MLRPVKLLLAASLAAGVLLAGTPVRAVEVEGFTLSDQNPEVKRDYGPIPGQHGVLAGSMSNCQNLPSAANIPVEMNFSKQFGHLTTIIVSWPNPDVNDLDIFFMDEEGERLTQSATGGHPEEIRLAHLPNGLYYLCVVNFSGPNAGFTVEASVRVLELFTRTPAPQTPAPERTPAPTPRPTPPPPPPEADDSPAVRESVNTPGPDGPLSDQELAAVSGERQAARAEGGRSVTEIVFLALTGLIVAAAAALLVLRIRRDTTG